MHLYPQLKGVGKVKTFHQAAMHNVGIVVDVVGDKKYDYAPIRLHRQTIRCIFNTTSFDTGGRFYGGW
jgi:rRNA processing protein Gar1